MPAAVACDYCGRRAPLVTGREVYPHRPDLHAKQFYQCRPCGAYVGVHPNTTKPLGRLANAELRRAKMSVHAAFDPIWKEGGRRRGDAYAWLARELGISRSQCHVGMFDLETCRRAIAACRAMVANSHPEI